MKKYLLCLVVLSACHRSFAQHIDDAGFAQGIRNQCPACIDAAGNLTDAARVQTGLTVSQLGVKDLKGIEGFSSLSSIVCTNSKLTTLPSNLPASLQSINVQFNEITSLPTLPSGLKTLDCSDNLLTTLPNLPSSLRILDCSYNQITTLPTLSNDLVTLFCYRNQLSKIPPLPDKLEGLMCSYNAIKTLPLLPQRMIRLTCQYTNITCLPLLPEHLIYLDLPRTVVCLPNIVKDATVNYYNDFIPLNVVLPLCNDLQSPPCDTFPRYNPLKDSTNTTGSAAKITIFPNPTEGSVKIRCANCVVKKVSVFNAIGQLIQEANTTVLNFANLGTGMYLVRVETVGGETVVEKIMRM